MENLTYEQALVIAAKNGNKKGFEELYKRYYQKVYALARTTLKNDADAEDVLQQTFINAWQNIGKLDDVTAFNTWIQRITLNQCYSLLRQRKENISIDFTEDDEDSEPIQLESDIMLPEVYAEQADLKVRLGRIIDDLSDVQRQTIMLFYFDQFSVEEIAKIMDCSENTVKSRLFLARKAIKTEIEEQERKTGTKFYGIAGIPLLPFAKLFVEQVKNASISESEAASLLPSITGQTAGVAVNTAVNAGTTVTKTIASESTKTAAKYSLKSLGKTIATKVVAGLVAIGMVSGGAAGTVYQINAVESFDVSAISENKSYDASENKEKSDTRAYSAYLDLLTESKQEIDSYTWQRDYFGNKELTKENASHPVVFCDIYGDETPEMIYIMANEFSGYQSASLNIVTYENDQAKSLYFIEYWDSLVGGGFYYYLYQLEGDKTLYAFESTGDDWWSHSYHEFETIGDTLTLTNLYEYIRKPDYEHYSPTTGPETIKEYTRSGTISISGAEYNSAVDAIESKTSSVLMYNYNCSDYALNYVAENGCPAMMCDEAIAYLREQLGIPSEVNATESNPDDAVAAYKAFVEQKHHQDEWTYDIEKFALYDLNKDGTPELFTLGGGQMDYCKIFTYKSGSVHNVHWGSGFTVYDNGIIYYGFNSGFGYNLNSYYSLDNTLEMNLVFRYAEWISLEGTTYSIGDKAYEEDTERVSYEVVQKKVLSVLDNAKTIEIKYHSIDEPEVWNKVYFKPNKLDKCLDGNPYKYNNDLATICAELSLAVYNGENDSGIRSALYEYGFDDDHIHSNNYGGSLAFTIASRFLEQDDTGNDSHIMIIVAQGSTNFYELYMDAMTSAKKSYNGYPVYDLVKDFYNAITEKLNELINADKLDPGSYKVLLTGHSLGGAAVNLVAASLLDNQSTQEEKDEIYCYTFGAIDSIKTPRGPVKDGYENIHNIYNLYDTFSPYQFGLLLPSGAGSGYGKFGHMDFYIKDHRYPGEKNYPPTDQLIAAVNHGMGNYYIDVAGENKTVQNSSMRMCELRETGDYSFNASIIACPVDIYIYDSDGNLIAWTLGNELNNENSDSVVLFIDPNTSTKYVYWLKASNYSIVFHGSDTGTMTYRQCLINSLTNEIISEKKYSNVSLEKGKLYGIIVHDERRTDDALYEVNNKGRIINSISSNGSPSKVLFASNIIGWLSVVITAIGIIALVVDIFAIIRVLRKRKSKKTEDFQ